MSATLGNLVDNNHGLRIFCDACSRESEVDVDQLLALYGRDLTLPEVVGKRSVGNVVTRAVQSK